jgi:hypothetical protein
MISAISAVLVGEEVVGAGATGAGDSEEGCGLDPDEVSAVAGTDTTQAKFGSFTKFRGTQAKGFIPPGRVTYFPNVAL